MSEEGKGTDLVEVQTELQEAAKPAVLTDEAITIIKHNIDMAQKLVYEVLEEGVDYGRIHGTPAPSLWDPGAGKISAAFNVYPKYALLHAEESDGLVSYTVESTLLSRGTGKPVSTGIGAASTRETKYKYRWHTAEEAREFGYSPEQLEGFKKNKDNKYRIPNPEYGELVNTIVKMASKRCLGSTTPILVKTNQSVVRTNLSKMYLLYQVNKGHLFVPGTDNSWREVKNMFREENRQVFRIALADGSYIRATEQHCFPTQNGLKEVSELREGDILKRSQFSIPTDHRVYANPDYGWVAGLFLADGHYLDDKRDIRFTLNTKETAIAERIKKVACPLGSRVSIIPRKDSPNTTDVGVYGEAFSGVIRQFIEGSTSYNKRLSRFAWSQNNEFLASILEGYLCGDGQFVDRLGRNEHWLLGFTGKNYELAEDLRCITNILGHRCKITRKQVIETTTQKEFPTFKGWIKSNIKTYNKIELGKIVSIKKETKPAIVYDLEVDGDHLFVLSNGIQSHNSDVDAVQNLPAVSSALRKLFGQPINERNKWRSFWGKVNQFGLTEEQVHKVLGVASVNEWLAQDKTLEQAIETLARRPEESKAELPDIPFIEDKLLQGWKIARDAVKRLKITGEQIQKWFAHYNIELGLADFEKPVPPVETTNEMLSRFVDSLIAYEGSHKA